MEEFTVKMTLPLSGAVCVICKENRDGSVYGVVHRVEA